MDVQVQLCHAKGNDFVVVVAQDITLTYGINPLGLLFRTFVSHSLEYRGSCTIDKSDHPHVLQVRFLFEKCARNIDLISRRLKLDVRGTAPIRCRTFSHLIYQNGLNRLEQLDLSNLGIQDTLPYHIGFFKSVRHLNLANNGIRLLPPELSLLTCLETLNLKGNPIAEIPLWVRQQMPHLRIEFDVVKCDSDQMAQSNDDRSDSSETFMEMDSI